jgi:hypothetical protein
MKAVREILAGFPANEADGIEAIYRVKIAQVRTRRPVHAFGAGRRRHQNKAVN